MKQLKILITSLVLFGFIPIAFATSNSPVGNWTTIDDKTGKERAVVEISQLDDKLYGTIQKVYKQAGDLGHCIKCPGKFKDKNIVGLTFLWDLKKSGNNVWSSGQILDPKNGKIYRAKATLSKNGKKLYVRGYMGVSLLGRTQVWVR